MKYKIVDKSTCPNIVRGVNQIWKPIFDDLPTNKAVQINFETMVKARSKGNSVRTSLKSAKANYSVSYRIVPQGKGFSLFIWKREVTK